MLICYVNTNLRITPNHHIFYALENFAAKLCNRNLVMFFLAVVQVRFHFQYLVCKKILAQQNNRTNEILL